MSSRDYVLLGDIPLPFPLIFIHRHEFHVRVLSTKLHFPDGLTLVCKLALVYSLIMYLICDIRLLKFTYKI